MSMDELRKIALEEAKDVKPGTHVCKYCSQGFVRESTLSVHMCEPKRRVHQQHEKGVIIGFNAWLRFFELTQGSAKFKTYSDFCDNTFYNAFVKFGRHCVGINAINTGQFTDYVLKQQLKIDNWCKEKVYDEYLFQLLRNENSSDALERSILTMQDWAEDTNNDIINYFEAISNGKFVQHIINGRVSPWVVYCCDSGIVKLESLTEEHISMIIQYIEPDFWQRKLRDYPADAEMNRHILAQAGF